ncbi:DNA-processing protein DprA [Pelagibacterium limicola]|uniref:DNA-processing protein DprA n=1 Tax=Pelagibacterium limicola TaxID=2791022 RepID=UPI0018AF64B0|nr:DNA-processing protein DprA [Pelagibacterium limicola]
MTRERLTPTQRVDWLRLIRTDNVGPQTFLQLISRFGSAGTALEALPGLIRRNGTSPSAIPAAAEAEDEIARAERIGARFVALGEPDYPPHLEHIHAPPPLIAVKGSHIVSAQKTIGIVGARNASAAGRRMAQLLASDLGNAGYAVVSGLARGIDAAAHDASLRTGTIAVLAGGLDRLYPQENIPLAEAIVDQGGALVSEMPFGWEARARDFPRRNRLVAGISLGVVIVEAAKRSGSLITARLALEQNREVFAVPGSPLDPRAEGGNALIRQGAILITSAEDIINDLAQSRPPQADLFQEDDQDQPLGAVPDPTSDERTQLLDALSPAPVSIDTLVEVTGLPAGTVQILLLELDLAGRIERSGGQLVALRI